MRKASVVYSESFWYQTIPHGLFCFQAAVPNLMVHLADESVILFSRFQYQAALLAFPSYVSATTSATHGSALRVPCMFILYGDFVLTNILRYAARSIIPGEHRLIYQQDITSNHVQLLLHIL
jgi:hypothetical protein